MQQDSPPNAVVDALPPYEYDAAITRPLHPPSRRSHTHPAFEHAQSTTNLPSGFFILRSRAPRGRCFDVLGHKSHDGAELGLHPVKEPVLRFTDSLQVPQNNQVFFLDWDGHLQSASASRPVDASLDEGLSISIQRPIMSIPSQHSHPLPRFRLDSSTATLHVEFGADPSFPGPTASSTAWRDDFDYIVEAVASRKKSGEEGSVWQAASSGLATASKDLLAGLGQLSDTTPRSVVAGFGEALGGIGDKLGGLGLFSKSAPNSPRLGDGPPPPPPKSSRYPGVRSPLTSPPLASTSSSRHPDSPLPSLPPDDHSDSDSDSDPSAFRPLRIVRLPRAIWREKLPSEVLQRPPGMSSPQLGLAPSSTKELRTWRRRQWEVVPIVVRPKHMDGVLPPPPLASSHLPGPPSRWTASTLASSAGGLVTSISGSLRSPLMSHSVGEEDQVFAVGDEDAQAVESSTIERFGRSTRSTPSHSTPARLNSPSLIPVPSSASPSFDTPLPDLPSVPSVTPSSSSVRESTSSLLEADGSFAGDGEVAGDGEDGGSDGGAEVVDEVTEGKGKAREAALA